MRGNWTAPGLPEAIRIELCSHWSVIQHGVVTLLGFSGRDVADVREQLPVVEPAPRVEYVVFHGLK